MIFFLTYYFKGTIIRTWTSKLRRFSEMFERNPLAVKSSFSTGIGNSEPSGGGNSIADNFDVCNWRPDSETVASRAFAQASGKIEGLRWALCQFDRMLFRSGEWTEFFLMNFLLQRILARLVQNIFWNKEGVPRVFGSVSQSRIWLDNHGGYSSRISWVWRS